MPFCNLFMGRPLYITSIIFYLLYDDVTTSSAANLHLTFDLGFAPTGVCTMLWPPVMTAGGTQTNPPRHRWLPDCLSARSCMRSHLPRHASAAAGSQCGNFLHLQMVIWSIIHSGLMEQHFDAFIYVSTIGRVLQFYRTNTVKSTNTSENCFVLLPHCMECRRSLVIDNSVRPSV